MKAKICTQLSALTLLLSMSSPVFADMVKTNSDNVISGKMLTFKDGICVFKSNYGAILNIPTFDISALATDNIGKITLVSGEIVHGKLLIDDDNTLLVSSSLGSSPISIASIISINRQLPKKKTTQTLESIEYGEEEKQAPPLDFITGSTVLLGEGDHQIEFGFDYRQNRDHYALPSVGYFENHSYTARMVRFDTTLRSGWANGIETFVSIPITVTKIEQVSSNEFVRDISDTRLADINLGVQYLLVNESAEIPAITFSTIMSVPTGKKKFYNTLDDWKDPLNNSTGHWGLTTGLSFVRTTDPAIIFGGFNISYSFDEKFDGVENKVIDLGDGNFELVTTSGFDIEPGIGISSYFGVGYALNDRLSVGSRFSHSYYADMKVNGETIHGSSSEAMDLSLSMSYRLTKTMVITPQVTFSLNNDAGAPSLSLRLSRAL